MTNEELQTAIDSLLAYLVDGCQVINKPEAALIELLNIQIKRAECIFDK